MLMYFTCIMEQCHPITVRFSFNLNCNLEGLMWLWWDNYWRQPDIEADLQAAKKEQLLWDSLIWFLRYSQNKHFLAHNKHYVAHNNHSLEYVKHSLAHKKHSLAHNKHSLAHNNPLSIFLFLILPTWLLSG